MGKVILISNYLLNEVSQKKEVNRSYDVSHQKIDHMNYDMVGDHLANTWEYGDFCECDYSKSEKK